MFDTVDIKLLLFTKVNIIKLPDTFDKKFLTYRQWRKI